MFLKLLVKNIKNDMSNLLTRLGNVYRDIYFDAVGRKGGYITQEERNRARKRNRKKNKK